MRIIWVVSKWVGLTKSIDPFTNRCTLLIFYQRKWGRSLGFASFRSPIYRGEGSTSASATIRHPHPLVSSMADEEPVDQKKYLEESCKPKCVRPLRAYQSCIERIKGDDSGHKHCTGQYFDYWSCVDTCVAPRVFSQLK